jgi:toxin ParE1/3/4
VKIIWSPEAIGQIDEICDYISNDNPLATVDVANAIFDAVEKLLPDNPHAGRPGRVAGTRELLVTGPYIVAYQVGRDVVEILTVRHGARLWPEEF